MQVPGVSSKKSVLRGGVLLVAALVGVCADAGAAGTDHPPVKPKLTIPRVTRPPKLEDFLHMDPPDTLGMVALTEFTQRRPDDGKPASERTVVYLGYDQKFL